MINLILKIIIRTFSVPVRFGLSLWILFSACPTGNEYSKITASPMLITDAVHDLNDVVMGNNFGPIVANRNYFYASGAAYEVIAVGYPEKCLTLSGQLKGLENVPPAPENELINSEVAALLVFCRPG